MSSHILGDKDVNAAIEQQQPQAKDVKSMDYHRQVFHSKMAQEPYVYREPRSTKSTSTLFSSSSASSHVANTPTNTTNSDASSCSSSCPSPVPSLISDSDSSSSFVAAASSPAPSITAMPRWPANKSLAPSAKQYVSPSDNIMSPCTAKINALRNKHVSKYVYLPRTEYPPRQEKKNSC